MIKIRPTWDFYVRCGLALAAFVFILYRVFSLEFVADEWGMWRDSIQPGLEALLTFQHKDPQSHFLEGLCAMPFLKYLPVSRITAIRLPSFLVFAVYVIAGFLVTQKLKNPFHRILVFAVWLCPQNILEYFGLARGYPFLIAFSGLAYYGLIEAYNPQRSSQSQERWSKMAIVSGALAMLALMSFAYGFLLLAFFLLLRYFLLKQGTFRQRLGAIFQRGGFVIATSLLLYIFYLPRYLILRDRAWGGTSNFISDTFTSVIACATYINWSKVTLNLRIALVVFAVLLLDMIAIFWQTRKARKTVLEALQSPLMMVSAYFIGCAVLAQLTFWFLGVQFSLRRTVLYLWPVIVLMLGYSLQEVDWRPIRWLNIPIMTGFLAFAACTYNTYMAYEHQMDAQNVEIAQVLYDLAKDHPPSGPLIVGMTDWLRYTIWYYYEEEYPDMPVAPQLKDHPIFRLHGDKLLTYSLNYAIPKKVPRWHIHPRTDYYLLQGHYEGDTFTTPMDFDYTIPPPRRLMDLEPVCFFPRADVTLYKARPGVSTAGCDLPNCPICNILPQLPAALSQPAP